jgi:glycerol uptake facilitator-like aquaporin
MGVVAANLSFAVPAITISSAARDGAGRVVAEGIATFVLVLVILTLVRTGRSASVPAAVGAWVATIVFATSSTGFANPAVTIARMLTDTYTGIAPSSVVGFITVQIVAGIVAALVAQFLHSPTIPAETTT